MKSFIVLIVLCLSCTIDYSNHTVYSKKVHDKDRNLCEYDVWQTGSWTKFYADCDCYDIGDSLNKWYRIAQKNIKVENQDSAQQNKSLNPEKQD